MKALHPTYAAVSLPVTGFLTHWLATLRARLQRRPTDDYPLTPAALADDYPLTPAALADMGLNESDLMAIRSGLFEGDGTRRGR